MQRRDFLHTGIGLAAIGTLRADSAAAAEPAKPLRVALVGCGWYGKTDLFHLMQVAPNYTSHYCCHDAQFTLKSKLFLFSTR